MIYYNIILKNMTNILLIIRKYMKNANYWSRKMKVLTDYTKCDIH